MKIYFRSSFIMIFMCMSMSFCFAQGKKTYAYLAQKGYLMVLSPYDSLIENGQYKACIDKLHQKIESHDTSYMYDIYYNFTVCYTLIGCIDSAFYYLNKFVWENPFRNDFVYVHVAFDTLRTYKNRWEKITEAIEREYLQRDSIIQNQTLAVELFRMGVYDQQYRGLIRVSIKDSIFDWNLQEKIDKQNKKKLDKIVHQYGWPTISKVGIEGSLNAFFILQHAYPIPKKYYNIYSKAYRQGDVLKGTYASLTDRYRLQNKKKQLYGTQSTYIKNIKTLSPVEDFKNINQRRKEMGYTATIEEYCKEKNIRIPEEYYSGN